MKAPKAPDPVKTAEAQGQINKDTAIAQYGLNATNQYTPYGNLTYSQIGNWSDGTPRYAATQTLSGNQQRLLNNEEQLGINLTGLGVQQSARLGQLLSSPFNLSNEATESRLMELGRKRLDPALDRRRASTEQDLYNRGVRMGSDAYNTAQTSLNEGENDAYNQLLLTGRQQAVNEALTQRTQPINEILALAGAGQVTQPNFVNTPGAQISPADYQGAVNQQYQSQLANYQAGMSGLFGLGSAAIGGWAMSDERLKTDKEKVGETDDGIGVYKYRFKGSPMMQLGVMAQDVKKKMPEAVARTPSGYYAVNYDRVGV
ncbi:tail fiber domain-containing protein [Rhizobium sp. BK251]|uniref:tail fiber domain-containing protein n=1 Tax=Rhizobium sp. BK251 TaxID=2512125 RepID=UPI00105244BB|nr:tail fiber domain-containing protein [Rhizobium sp. BK251]TCL70534.1 endosialidase-like protein [Rhizobium sp. BK251]